MQAKEKSIEDKLFCMKRKLWALIIYILQAIILVLMLGAFGSNRWVSHGNGDNKWTGGLLRVTTGPTDWEDVEYIDMAESCDQLQVPCEVFKSLRSGGAAFCFFEVIAYMSTIVWMTKITFMILQRPFLNNLIVYIWPSVGLGCHILAEIIWSGVTKAKFDGSCKDIKGDELCSTQGPAVVLTVTCLYIVAFALFIVFYIKRFE